jgi:carboxypeptidase family protein
VKWWSAAALACAALLGGRPVLAQQSIEYASISGRVADVSGAVVPGADVTATQVETGVIHQAVSDREGRFRFPSLRPGVWELTVRQDGFQDASRRLTLAAGAAFELPITLTLAVVDTQVTVTGETVLLEAARSQIVSTVRDVEIATVPLNGRNFLDLALLVPGVSPANTGSPQLFPETSGVAGGTLSFGSQRNLSNNFMVDGLSANDDAAALSGMVYGVDAVEQMQVVTSGGQAELGRALGGYVNVVTKSGTNVLHGTAYNYFRDDSLNAAHALSGETLPMRQFQFGGSAGGPIASNRTFYFGNVEARRLDQTGLVAIATENVAAINARLAASRYAGPALTTGDYPNPIHSTSGIGKIDHRAGGRDQLSVRYTMYDVASENARGAGGLNAPTASTSLDNIDQAVAVSNTFTISPRTVLETRAQFAHGDLKAPPSDPVGPSVAIAGVATFGTSATSPTARAANLYQLVNSVAHQTGAHAIRAGVDVLVNDVRITFPRAVRGSYTFASLPAFLAGLYNNAGFTQTFGASEVAQVNPNVGIYAQDEWKATGTLTLNLGARYDLQFLDTIETDTDNFAPRVGIAWSPLASRHTIVRAGTGLFYDRVPLRAVANALLSAGNTTDPSRLRQATVALSPTQSGAPVFPAILTAAVASTALPNLTTIDRELQNAYSRQASIEVEQQVGNDLTVSVGYQYLRGLHLLMAINQNVPSCVAAGGNNGCRPNPGYANNSQYSSVGDSTYHALQFSLVQRPRAWGQYRVSYTLSKSMNDVGEFFFSAPIDPFDVRADWGRSDDDQRHRLVLSGAIRSPRGPARNGWEGFTHGWEVSGVVQSYSALPYNITSGLTTVQGTAGRPVVNGAFIERNAGASTSFLNVGVRVSRVFRLGGRIDLELLGEGFNLTNHVNVVTRNGTFGTDSYPANPLPSFGTATAVGEPRTFQLGARVRF